ncbi:MAG: hypothetical protein ACRYGR_05345 [Janthinobacterium lividum]
MKKLLQATSALALIVMSSQAFATDVPTLQYDDVQKAQITRGLIGQGKTDQEIADFFKALNIVQTTLSPNLLETTPASNPISQTPPVSDPVPQASVVSTPVPEPTIEQAVQEVAQKTLRSLPSFKNPSLPFYKEFRQVFVEYLGRAPCEKKEFAFPHYINKILEVRLYDSSTYVGWSKAGTGKANQAEKSMAPTDVQRNAYYSYMYKAMNERYNIEIDEFKAIGANDPRSLEAIVLSTFNPEVRLNTPQNIINDGRKFYDTLFKN